MNKSGGFEMEKKYLTFDQNLCSARIFLNIFGLSLENKEEIDEFTKLNILDKNNGRAGMLYFENNAVKMSCVTSLGNLNADYDISAFSGFKDLECGGALLQWNHALKFQVDGIQCFSGIMKICLKMDTDFGNSCMVHTKIKYTDENNNEVEIKFMEDGKPFSYEAKKDYFSEVLEIDPWCGFDSFMYHITRNGKYDPTKYCFPNDNVKYVCYGSNDRNYLKTVSRIVKNSQTIEDDSQLYEIVEKDNSVESTIQKGLLMHQIDANFSKKIIELINLFKKDNVSFLENLIDISFDSISEEEKRALFGTDIKRINYYNGADNLFDAYFYIDGNNQSSPKKIYTEIVKKIGTSN